MNRARRRRPSRRDLLAAAAALPAAGCLSAVAIRPAGAAVPETMEAAIREFAGKAAIRDGRVKLEIPALVENGNSVTLSVAVESPMSAADHVKTIAVFNEKNRSRTSPCSTSGRAPDGRASRSASGSPPRRSSSPSRG